MASLAIDGNTNGDYLAGASVAITQNELGPWWKVDLGELHEIFEIKVYKRTDHNLDRLAGFIATIYNAGEVAFQYTHDTGDALLPETVITVDGKVGDVVEISFPDTKSEFLELAEVMVIADVSE